MHNRIATLYSHVQLAGNKNPYKKVHDAFNDAAEYVHIKGSFSSNDLTHDKVKPLINETYKVLKGSLNQDVKTELPLVMRQKMQDDIFLFSGMKTYAQLKEASLLLFDANKNVKGFDQYLHDIQKIDATYNENYLRAEHQHAIAAVQSAAQYHEFMQDADRYDLQIRTAGDDHVRATHAILNNVTRPADDPYWNTTWTPFDWGCRCRIIQVLKGKYPVTDIGTANKASEKAIGELFKYNPGKEQAIFPPKHPYYKTSKQAMDVVKGMAPESEGGIDLNKIKGQITATHAKKLLSEYASKFPEGFSYGFEALKFLKSQSYMMQHSITVNRMTGLPSGKTIITISTNTFRNGFNPAAEFINGLNAIKQGKELTFTQEYAFESLWHEILHAKTRTKRTGLTALQREHMETVNQFVARHTYPQLIEAFGGKATNQQKVLDEGYGYSSWIKNFREKLANNGIDEKKAVEFLEPHLMTDYSNLGKKMRELFDNG